MHSRAKSIAIAGGGIMGCLAALVLADRGHRVTVFERERGLLTRASRQNEGKIHLGFTYGLDRSGHTQALMFDHGARFEARLGEILRQPVGHLFSHRRAICAIEDTSMLPLAEARFHFEMIERLHDAHLAAGRPPLSPSRPLVEEIGEEQRRALFGDRIIAAFDIAEPYADVPGLCDAIESAMLTHPSVDVVTDTPVGGFSGDAQPEATDGEGGRLGRFDAAVNATWDGIATIAGNGACAGGDCLRAKAGFVTRIEAGMPPAPVSFVWGSYGDLVPLGGDRAYLSWYPSCLMGFTTDLRQGAAWFDGVAAEFDCGAAYESTVAAFRERLPRLSPADGYCEVVSGAILAAAQSDIDDPDSGLHRRNRFGIATSGNVHVVNTGKLTCAPGLALHLAELVGE